MGSVATSPSSRWRIGRYTVVDRLGRGGMGMVYRALDESLERDVAIKVLTAEGLRDSAARRRFEVEAKAAAQLQHPNIVTIYELGEERGIPFIAMELLGGTDLDALMRSHESLLPCEKADIALQICRGLAYAHERHIVHRDIKPSNIRLLDDGTVKIVDFGIAKIGGVNLTQRGMVVGTVHYMSPEQVKGQALDGRSDIFSLGVILFELLQGARPFDGDTASEILFKIVHAPLPAMEPQGLELEPGLCRIVERALARPLEERYPSADAMAQDLAAIAGDHGADEAESSSVTPGVAEARRLLGEGKVDESIGSLTTILSTHPNALDARRAMRAARRTQAHSSSTTVAAEETFPELVATFGSPSPPAPETGPRQPRPARAPRAPRRSPVLWAVAGLVGLAMAASLILLWLASGRLSMPLPIEIRSSPPGARILVNGRDTGQRTNADVVPPADARELEVILRMEGFRDHVSQVSLPRADSGPLTAVLTPLDASVRISTTPPGARVALDDTSLDGVTPMEVTLDGQGHTLKVMLPGYAPVSRRVESGERPREWTVTLEPLGPPAELVIRADYPIQVLEEGLTLARGSGTLRVRVSPGPHVLTLVSSSHFLRTTRRIEAVGGEQSLVRLPGIGHINIQARPDNCEVHIDGFFADYPPILNRPVAAGRHRVEFRWPDGVVHDEAVEIDEGSPKFVTGRKS